MQYASDTGRVEAIKNELKGIVVLSAIQYSNYVLRTLVISIRVFALIGLVSACTVFLCACASDTANRYYLTERYPAKNPSEVEVLRTPPVGAYTVMADFQARGASIEYMRNEAAKIGADAVIVTLLGGSAATDQIWASEDRFSSTYSRITGTAIKFK